MGYHQFCGEGGEEGDTSSCDFYINEHPTTIPVSAQFFLFSIGGKKVYEPLSLSLSLSLSHTHTHKCNLSYFHILPVTYNVRLNAIQNIRVQNDKNHHNTKNMAKNMSTSIYLFFFKYVACAVSINKSHGRQMLNGYKACSLYESGSSRSLIYMHYP